jgi:hypothetical protein
MPVKCEADAASIALQHRVGADLSWSNKEGNPMQRLLICCAVGLALLFGAVAPTPASAYYYRHHHYRYHHNHHYYNHRSYHRHDYRYW